MKKHDVQCLHRSIWLRFKLLMFSDSYDILRVLSYSLEINYPILGYKRNRRGL